MVFRFKDLLVLSLIVFACTSIADYQRRTGSLSGWLRTDNSNSLGTEYYEISLALYGGDGFANPFRVDSGPTAWMPPFVPILFAALQFLASGQKNEVVTWVLAIQSIAIVVSSLLVILQSRNLGCTRWGYVLTAIGISTNFYSFFQVTDDNWWLILVVSAIWLCVLLEVNKCVSKWHGVLWGGCGGIAFLSSPAIGGAWLIVSFLSWKCNLRISTSSFARSAINRRALLSFMVSCCCVAPWMIRNKVVFGNLIPIKSNLAYEVWQSLGIDDDGLLDVNTLHQHPYTNYETKSRYVEIGEMAFMKEHWHWSFLRLHSHPFDAIKRIGVRFIATTLWYSPSILDAATYPSMTFVKRCVYPIPFFSMVYLLIKLRQRFAFRTIDPNISIAIAIYVTVLVPYVLVSYYERYAVPIWNIKVILVLYTIHDIYSRSGIRPSSSAKSWKVCP